MGRIAAVASSVFLLSVLLLPTSVLRAESKPGRNPIAAIEADYRAGQLSIDQKALLQVTAIKHPEQLPDRYRQLLPESRRRPGRNATMVFRDILLDWDQFTPETRQLLSAQITRPPGAYTYDSPSGFFKLHYDLTGSNAVPTEDSDLNGVPDYIERIAAYCDTALDVHRSLGYRDPVSDGTGGGDDKLDVYFENILDGYGYSVPEDYGPEPWRDATCYLVLHNDYIGFPPNTDPEGNAAGAAKATVAHEFHHCVQFAYDYGDLEWFMELDATYMEDIVFDQVNDNYNYLPVFMSSPETSLMKNDYHAYSTFIYGLYLARSVDTALMVSIWDGARYDDVFQSLNDTLQFKYGKLQDSVFLRFAMWNFLTGERDDGLHYEEGSEYPLVSVAGQHSHYPVSEIWSPSTPYGFASNYIQFFPAAYQGELRLTFNGADSAVWAAGVILSTSPNSHEFQQISLTPATYEGAIVIPNFEDYYSVTLVAVNLRMNGVGSSYQYSANVAPPLHLAMSLLSDTIFNAGHETPYTFQAINNSPTPEVIGYTAWDGQSWIVPDTVEKYILPGDSAPAYLTVKPPAGTPLGTTNSLYFKTWFKDDPTVFEIQSLTGEVVPQRGDVDYDGKITLSDVTTLIGAVFLDGPDPVPWWTGDFDCSGAYTLNDITQLIGYVYLGGSHSPCDPF
jgi:hypothetical protein